MTDSPQVPTGPHELELEILELRPALEAVLMVADQPLDHLTLAQAVGHPPAEVERALAELAAEYTEQQRGFELRPVGGGWRFFSRAEFSSAVERFILEDHRVAGIQTREMQVPAPDEPDPEAAPSSPRPRTSTSS